MNARKVDEQELSSMGNSNCNNNNNKKSSSRKKKNAIAEIIDL